MKHALLVLLVLIIVAGCGPAPTPEPTATPMPTSPPPPTDTPMPTDTPVPTSVPSPTATPQPEAVVAVDLLNLRAGPDTNYDILTMMEEGTRLNVVGRTEANDWLKVVTADGREGWVFAEMVTISGDLGAIAVAQAQAPAPATPTPLPSPSPEAPPATTEPPTPTPKPGILLEDDFSDPTSGWPEHNDGHKWWHENGEFHGLVEGVYYLTWQGYPGKVFSDFVLEADARKVGGPNGAGYGLAFRIAGWNNAYVFNISGDGNYTLFKIVDGKRSDLVGWTSALDVINRDNSTNHLLVVCQSSHIWCYINGQLVADVIDDSHAEGEIGFSIESQEVSDLHVAFDNIMVKPVE